MLKTVLAGIGVTSIVLIAAVSINAQYSPNDGSPPRLSVKYADFDLATDRGVRLLRHRIGHAVIRVCADEAVAAQAAGRAWDEVECHRDARAGVYPQLERAIAEARRPRYEAPAAATYGGREEHFTAPRPDDGVLGSAIDDRVAEAFQSGHPVWWRDDGWRGVVQVSESRRFSDSNCRTIAILRRAGGAWQPLRQGVICLRSDGRLHNGS